MSNNVVPFTGDVRRATEQEMRQVLEDAAQAYERTATPFPKHSGLYFNVQEGPVAFHHPQGTKGYDDYKVLYRYDDKVPVPLAVVGKNYKVVQNEELFRAIEHEFIGGFASWEMMHPSDVHPLEGVRVSDKMSYNGAMCLREYVFPNMRCRINDKSEIAFRTIVVNGFGGTSVKLYTGAIDFFCTNGMVRGQFDHAVMRHTNGLSIKGIADRVHRSIDVFFKDAELYRGWAKKTITKLDATAFFKSLGMSERMAEKLTRQYLIECQTHGQTVWALYSAMTYYATHNEGEFKLRETGANHAASTMLHREESVKKWIEHDAWQTMVA